MTASRIASEAAAADTSAAGPSAAPLPVVIVGAGPAGLAVAGALTRRGVRAHLLEAGESVGWAWRRHYPFLRLHTKRRDSSLPGWPLSAGREPYPGRDEFAAYLEAYARDRKSVV